MWSDMPVTRSQRGELRDEFDQFVGQGADDERLSEHEASEIGLEETLHSVKGVLGEIKDEESKLKELYKQVSGENRVLAERIERLESQDTVGWINRQADLETRINILQGNIERLTASSRSYEEIERQLETSSAEIRPPNVGPVVNLAICRGIVQKKSKNEQESISRLQSQSRSYPGKYSEDLTVFFIWKVLHEVHYRNPDSN
jgi:chromosome segregation ATPase